MYEQVEKTKENKSRVVANSVTQKKSNGKQGFGFVNNRSAASAQRKLQEMVYSGSRVKQLRNTQRLIDNTSNINTVFQFVRTIKDAKKKLHPTAKKDTDIRRRAARSAQIIRVRQGGGNTGRNIFIATIHFGGRNHTFHLMSAGLGGAHPKSGGRSAAHTEQIWKSLFSSGIISRYLKMKSKPNLSAIYSRNEACDSNPGDPNGCRSIPTKDMGMPSNLPFYYSTPYSTGGDNTPPTLTAMSKMERYDREPDSDDEYVDTNKFRGQDLDKLTDSGFKKAVSRNPPLL